VEARRREDGQAEAAGVYEADTAAGLWREVGGVRTLPLSPDVLAGAAVGVLFYDPRGGSKVIAGIDGRAV
jgi:hypothetical protein